MIGRNNLAKLIDYCYREPLMKFRIMKEKGFSLYTTGNSYPFVFMVDGRIPHEGMWKSAFPEYAARIGNVNFERVEF